MSKFFKVDLGFYPHSVYVSYDQTKKELTKSLKSVDDFKNDLSHLIDDFVIQNVTARAYLNDGRTLIKFKEITNPTLLAGIIAHEAFHVTVWYMDYLGDELKINVNEESYAYMIEHLVSSIYEEIIKE